jgi:hypothetical protein
MIWVSIASVMLAGTDPAAASTWTYSTPPLPPGIVCGGERRELHDLPLTPETTYAEVTAAWGEPMPEGPAGEVAEYSLTCSASVWLSFEPGGRRRLVRALLLSGYGEEPQVIFNNLPITQNRRCNQLRPGPRQSGRMIARVWGPPDNKIGSGIERWIYLMRGGGFAQVFPQRNIRFDIACTSYPSDD